jgi:2-polyprenyl-6-methoxyphenol hydroxylase-like FAD-dependent oxidoreductase
MATVAMIGGGAVGMIGAMLLAGDGHDVTVLERDPALPPEPATAAWDEWERRSVGQFRMIHYFLPPFRRVLETELPAVVTGLLAAGALEANAVLGAPAEITGGAQPGDERFGQLTGRRPVVEAVLAIEAARTPGVTIRRGIAVKGLLAGAPGGAAGTGTAAGVPHVVGVLTGDGEEVRADVVVDVSGRRSAALRWLEALGGPAPRNEEDDSGFVYYGRHFRSEDGSLPFAFGPPLQSFGSFSILALPADNGTWGMGIVASSRDEVLRSLKEVDRWMAVVGSCPLLAHWTDAQALTGVDVMARIEDRYRSFVVDGRPVVTGLLPLGDAWACTNPSVGRGASIGALHAVALRDHLRTADLADPESVALGWDALTDERVTPHYRGTVAFDRHRLAEIEAHIAGRPYETDDAVWLTNQALAASLGGGDPDLFRAFVSVATMLRTAEDVAAEPGLAERVAVLGAQAEPPPGPSRAELVALATG